MLEEKLLHHDLEKLLKERVPYHKKYMYYSAYWVPLSCTFVIVPLIPNIPLAYNLFRLYSHYKAYKGADHLNDLMNNGLVIYEQDKQLDAILDNKRFVTAADIKFPEQAKDEFKAKKPNLKLLEQDLEGVLSEADIKLIGEALDMPGIELELNRARTQILKGIALDKFN